MERPGQGEELISCTENGEQGRMRGILTEPSGCHNWLDIGDNKDGDSKLTPEFKSSMRGEIRVLLIEIRKKLFGANESLWYPLWS